MPETLGILVTSDQHLNYVVKLTETAHNKGKKIKIFFTGKAVKLIESRQFKRLVGKASLSICEWSSLSQGLADRIPGIDYGIFETQVKYAEIIKDCDRFVVL